MKKRTVIITEKHEVWVIRQTPNTSSPLVDVEDVQDSGDIAPVKPIAVATQTSADENKNDDA